MFKYYDSNSSFDLHQTLNPNSSTTIKDVDLTDDYQSLIFTNSDYTFLYEFNGADYDLVEQFTLPAFQVRMCDDKSFFVLSYYETLAIYEKNGNTYTYSYDIFDNYVATQTFQIDLSGDCNYLISFFGMLSSYIYKYDGSNWTVIE